MTHRLVFTCFILMPVLVAGQTATISPYSRYGIGETGINVFSQGTGMGGESFSLSTPSHINYANPAASGFYNRQTMVFEAGLVNDFQRLRYPATDTLRYNHVYMSHIAFGFPVLKWWKVSLGLSPFSRMNYSFTERRTFTGLGEVAYSYSGNGEIDRVFLSNAFTAGNFSIGAEGSFLFGTLDYLARTGFESSSPSNMFAMSKNDELKVSDVFFRYGLVYKNSSENLDFSAGAVYTPKTGINTTYTSYAVNADKAYFSTNSYLYVKDTVSSFSGKENIIMPEKIGFGLSVERNKKWLMTTAFAMEKWSAFHSPVDIYELSDARSFSCGFQYVPDFSAVNSFFKIIRYRFGVFSRETPLVFHGIRIMDRGIGFGAGIPLKRSQTTVNVGVAMGTVGTTRKNLFEENYVRLYFALSLNDVWFVKRKIE